MIVRKLKPCQTCLRPSYIFSRNRCKSCAQKEYSKPKQRTPISRIVKPSCSGELTRWFQDRRNEMTGRCTHCGKPSCATDDQFYKFSIAHILPKNFFKSIKTHPDNWIELCFWGDNSCHTMMDNNLLDLVDLNCWDRVVTKFQNFYPDISTLERRRIPTIFSNYIEIDT